MTEENTNPELNTPDELTVLKKRADQMGIKYHPKIGLDKLRAKVNNILSDNPKEVVPDTPPAAPITPVVMTEGQRHAKMRKDAGRLVRIRVSCMNPNKKEYEGEIFTVSNRIVGTFKKYVPYNIDGGWHVPHIIYEHLKERQCQIFYTTKGPRGDKIRKGKLIREFAIEILDPLTPGEMKDLATRQAMANNLD